MKNPWLDLPTKAPFVLSTDSEAIDEHNASASESSHIDTGILPEPFIGRLDAPIVILMTNPGWSPWDHLIYSTPYAHQLYEANLRQEPLDYPFYMIDPRLLAGLDPAVSRIKPRVGPYWWLNTLKQLITFAGTELVSKHVLGIEYFPYHSIRNPGMTSLLESQRFSFELVRQAMEREAAILVSRSIAHWHHAVPGLSTYSQLHQRAPKMQNPMITRRIHPTGFDAACRVLMSVR